jgi:stage III sporulation protein AG
MTQQSIDLRLEEILSCIDGAGKVRVFLSEAAGEQTIFQTDEEVSSGASSSSSSSQTVIISGSDRTEQGMIVQIIPPRYQGAVIVCQGADRASVRLAIVEAVSNATGLASDRITVLKMK